ncbi:MAG: hypothetical protein ACREHV_07940 [Rhizomicrobium sp.]
MSGFVVVNPRSAGGRTAREWPQIERALRAAYPRASGRASLRSGRMLSLQARNASPDNGLHTFLQSVDRIQFFSESQSSARSTALGLSGQQR